MFTAMPHINSSVVQVSLCRGCVARMDIVSSNRRIPPGFQPMRRIFSVLIAFADKVARATTGAEAPSRATIVRVSRVMSERLKAWPLMAVGSVSIIRRTAAATSSP